MSGYEAQIQNYINTVIKYIRCKNYHIAIQTELKNHIDDSITDLMEQGLTKDNALEKTLKDMGEPEALGEQLNSIYKPEYNKMFDIAILCFIILVMVMEYHAHKELLNVSFNIMEKLLYLFCGGAISILLFHSNLFEICTRKKYIMSIPLILASFCIVLYKTNMQYSRHIINGSIPFFIFLFCIFIGMLKNKRITGIVLSLMYILSTVCIGIFVSSYSNSFLLFLCSGIILYYSIYKDWFGKIPKKIICIVLLLFFILGTMYMIYRKMDNIILNRVGFLPQGYLKNAHIIGMCENMIECSSQVGDYPLLMMILRYGYVFLFIYIMFIGYVNWEIIHIYKNQQTFIGKIIVLSIQVAFIIETVFSILVNLGVPFIKGFNVPFLDFNFEIIAILVCLELLELMDCFGNYIFIEDVVRSNKLFDIENGKIILYYK